MSQVPPASPSPPPSLPQARTDTDDRKVKKYEELLALAKIAWDADIARLDAAESKASRLVALPIFVAGLLAAGFDHFIEAFKAPRPFVAFVFIGTYLVTAVLKGIAFGCFFRALTVSKVMMLPLDGKVEEHFRKNLYVDAIVRMASEYFDATREMRAKVDAKPRWVRIGFRRFTAALVAGVIALGSYALWQSGKPLSKSGGQMSDNQPEQAPPADVPAPSPVEPQPTETGPKFVEVERGVPDTSHRDTVEVPKPER